MFTALGYQVGRVMVVASVVVLLSGCSGTHATEAPSIAPMWADAIQRALDDPGLSDFERQVLSDDDVTDAEFREAQDRFTQCMADLGWVVAFNVGQGGYSVSPDAGNPDTKMTGVQPDNMQCQKGTLSYIEPIYLGLRDNPRGLDFAGQIQACYARRGVHDGADLGHDQFAAMLDAPDYLPSSRDAAVCMVDPNGTSGITTDQVEWPPKHS